MFTRRECLVAGLVFALGAMLCIGASQTEAITFPPGFGGGTTAITPKVWGPCSDPVPASISGSSIPYVQAMTHEVCTKFSGTVGSAPTLLDASNTRNPGFEWYIYNKWPGLALGDTAWQTFSPGNSGDYKVDSGGGLALTNTSANNTDPLMESCVYNGAAGTCTGTTFSGSMYVQTTTGSSPTVGPPNSCLAIWAMPLRFLATATGVGSGYYFVEPDWQDCGGDQHDVQWLATNPGVVSGGSPIGFNGFSQMASNSTFGQLILAPANNGGVNGILQGYYCTPAPCTVAPQASGPQTVNNSTNPNFLSTFTDQKVMLISGPYNTLAQVRNIQVWSHP